MPAGGMRDVDFTLLTCETQRIPFLLLPAILAAPGLTDDLAGNVVDEPLLDLAELLDRSDVGFFMQLAQRRRPRVLAGIDAPLRHLPDVDVIDVLGAVDATPDEDKPSPVEVQQDLRMAGKAMT